MAKKQNNGIYKSKDELYQNVHYLFHHENNTYLQISELVGIHEDTVKNILKKQKV